MRKLPLSFMVCLFLLLLFLFVKLKGPYQTNDWYILSRFRTCFLFRRENKEPELHHLSHML